MEFDITNFHFLRPLWLTGLPVAWLAWLTLKRSRTSTKWETVMPKEVVAVLRIGTTKQSYWLYRVWLLSWTALVIAAAGPAWVKQAVPMVKNSASTILVLDLSPSMLAEDLRPNRLRRAKLKLIDILRQHGDGQVALVAYAGDAHTVSPLTDDPRNLEALLSALHPNIMPLAGSNTEAAITLATTLLKDAGVSNGEILLISDGVSKEAISQINRQFNRVHSLSILGVGSQEPSPIPAQGGGFLRNSNEEIVLAKMDRAALKDLASGLGGKFAALTADDSDTQFLLNKDFQNSKSQQEKSSFSSNVFDAWTDMGHWLVVLVLPLLLVFFRKGSVYLLPLLIALPLALTTENTLAAQESSADGGDINELASDRAEFTWKDLWQTRDQQAAQLYTREEYAAAAKTFDSSDWSAIAHYREGNFAQAAEQLEPTDNPANLYNKGNALALSGALEEAINAYDAVLKQDAEHSDAAFNKRIVEQLLQQAQQDQPAQDKSEQDQSQQSQADKNQSEQDQANQDRSQDQKSQDSQQSRDEQSKDQPKQEASQAAADDQSQTEREDTNEATSGKGEDENDEDQKGDSAKNEADEPATPEGEEQAQTQLTEADSPPLKDASEQWLRTIPDDPGGLLRRKFQYQSRQRDAKAPKRAQERY